MKAKEAINALTPYQPGKGIEEVKKEYNLTHIVRLASNENVYGCSPYVKDQLSKFGNDYYLYPDGYAKLLRTKLVSQLHIDKDQLIFGSGSDEIVQMICRTYLEKGSNTVMAWPTFPQYRHHAIIEGATIKEVPLVDGKHDLDKMLEAIDSDTRIVWLCTPNNPTGCYINQSELMSFINACPSNVLIVIDEAYYEYVLSDDYPESIPLLNSFENLLILRTFSKAYGLAGLRVGYGIGSINIISELNKTRGPFNVTSISQYAAYHALEDMEYIDNICRVNKETRKIVEDFCDEHNLSYNDSEANFLLIHLSHSGLDVAEKLLTYGYIVRAGELLGISNSIRVTIGKKEDMIPFLKALKELI